MKGLLLVMVTLMVYGYKTVSSSPVALLGEVQHRRFQATDISNNRDMRFKRAMQIKLGNAALAGLMGLKFLLKGSTEIPTGEKLRLHKKTGTYETAVKDFLTLDPRGNHAFNMDGGVVGRAGRVGDRLLVVRSIGMTGDPTIEVVTIAKTSRVGNKGNVQGKLTDIITYSE